MRVLVVLPTYNESATIEKVLRAVRANLPEADVLVVDDSSPDETAKIAEQIGAELGQIEVLSRPAKSGLGTAYRDGFRHGLATGHEVMVEMDSDLSHDPAALPTLVAPIEEGAELVIGSRYITGGHIPEWTLARRMLSRGANLYAAGMLGFKVRDSTAGFRAYAASLLERIDLESVRAESYGFQIEMTYRAHLAGARIVEVPIRFTDRTEGTSKMSMFTIVEALWLVAALGVRRLLGFARSSSLPKQQADASRR